MNKYGLVSILAIWWCAELAWSQAILDGREIFEGAPGSALDNATAEIGDMGVSIPASSFPCSSCHGQDGRGRAERGVVPSDLRQSILTRELKVVPAGRRARDAYDEDSFFRALTLGVDPSGNQLDATMPRFQLSREDVSSLWAYLDRLDQSNDVGVTESVIRIGVFQSQQEPDSARRAVQEFLQAFENRINQSGGLYGRQLELSFFDETGSADVFSVLVPNHDLAPETDRVIVSTRAATSMSENAFRLLPDQSLQVASLKKFAVEKLGRVKPLSEECLTPGERVVLVVDTKCTEGPPPNSIALFTHSAFKSWAQSQNPTAPETIYVALPYGLEQLNPDAQQAFGRLRSELDSRLGHGMEQAEAYSALVVVLEALSGSGRSLTQQRFIERLNLMTAFDGALVPPISFSTNRRVGSSGNLIAEFDIPTGKFDFENAIWIDPLDGR